MARAMGSSAEVSGAARLPYGIAGPIASGVLGAEHGDAPARRRVWPVGRLPHFSTSRIC